MQINEQVTPADHTPALDRLFDLAGKKVRAIDKRWDPANGTPVFTVKGQYTTRGWTEWTQGFQYGCAILLFDATGDEQLLELGRKRTLDLMAPHVTHVGVHDHGFNNLSTYGNLRRLMREGKIPTDAWENHFYEMAIKASAATQAARWAELLPNNQGYGFICSFNGPHSLFIDTMRTIRILGVGHQLGHVLMGENDKAHSLLTRLCQHALTTSKYIVFHGDTNHSYDVRGRTAHEGVFNRADGNFRCRSTQQGYAPFSTWTRGLAWAMVGYAEELEFLKTVPADDFEEVLAPLVGAGHQGEIKAKVIAAFEQAARDTCDHYINDVSTRDGMCYWDDGAPNLHKLGDWQNAPADPYNAHEPVDSSASAIAAQGLIRLGQYFGANGAGRQYQQAGLTVAGTLFDEPYLSTDPTHEGLILHSIYHRPNNWDHIPQGQDIPCDESSMWGDYHALELAVLVQRLANGEIYPTFFDQPSAG